MLARPCKRWARRWHDARVTHDYRLLDAGDGRRLGRMGRWVVDRPTPAASAAPRDPAAWRRADLVYEQAAAAPGRWTRGGGVAPWPIVLGGLTLELPAAAGGQGGLFAKHAVLWPWVRSAVTRAAVERPRPAEVLSLFAYTGGATLAAAGAGARVAHVDASRPAVAWARRNAELSGLGGRPVRWLVEDARTLVAREIRRGRRDDGFVVDPPSYGHGPSGDAWLLERDIGPLLEDLARLRCDEGAFLLLTAHTEGVGPGDLGWLVRQTFGREAEIGSLELEADSGAV